jgi:hypothetical protein
MFEHRGGGSRHDRSRLHADHGNSDDNGSRPHDAIDDDRRHAINDRVDRRGVGADPPR